MKIVFDVVVFMTLRTVQENGKPGQSCYPTKPGYGVVFELLLSVRFSRKDGKRMASALSGRSSRPGAMVCGLTGIRQGTRILKSRPFLDTIEKIAERKGLDLCLVF